MLLEILVGAVIGLLVGMSGLGGPMLFVPLLILFFGYKPTMAVGIALTFITVTKAAALIEHCRKGNVNFHIAKYFLIGSLPIGLIVSYVINLLNKNPVKGELLNEFLLSVIGMMLVLFSFFFFFETVFNYKKRVRGLRLSKDQKSLAIITGVFAGALIAATSIGAASLVALVLALLFRVKSNEIVGTDIFITMVVSGLSGLVYLFHGTVVLGDVYPFLIGSVPLAIIGTRFTELAKGKPLRVLISTIVFAGGMVLLYSIFA